MKNYYDELEISKTASKEVIEKVYKVLAKKYHPDITQEIDKHFAEEKFKIISEAYEILSNDEKRKKYDLELEQSTPSISYEDYMNVVNQNDTLTNSLNNLKNQLHHYNTNNNNNNNNNINSQTTYNKNYSTHYNYTSNTPNSNNTSTKNNSKKIRYYNVATGKPVSAFTYYCYKIKRFFYNIGILLLALLAIILAINAFTNNMILDFLQFNF